MMMPLAWPMRSRLGKADSNWCSRLAAMSAIAPWVANIAPIDRKVAIEQPRDQVSAFSARITLEAVKQTQRLDIDVCHHNTNVLFTIRRAGAVHLHLSLDALEVPHTRERPGEDGSGTGCITGGFGNQHRAGPRHRRHPAGHLWENDERTGWAGRPPKGNTPQPLRGHVASARAREAVGHHSREID